MSAIAILVALLAYPWVHNHYIHPLGRLQSQVEVGDHCGEIVAAFESYAANRAGSSDLQYVRDVTESNFYRTESVSPSTSLFLYDLSLFDDLQLYVRCSNDREDGTVVEKIYIGD